MFFTTQKKYDTEKENKEKRDLFDMTRLISKY